MSHQGEEVDLFFELNGKRFEIDVKFNLRPKISHSMTNSVSHLKLNHLIVNNPLGVNQEHAQKILMMLFESIHENFRTILKLN